MKIMIFFITMLSISDIYSKEIVSVYSPFRDSIMNELTTEFERDTKIKVKWEKISTSETLERLIKEKSSPKASFWLGGVGVIHIEAKNRGVTMPYISPLNKNTPKKFKDKDHFWYGLYIGPLAIAINSELIKSKGLKKPQGWFDLVKPQYKNLIRIANPNASGTAYNIITTILDIYNGDEQKTFNYMKKLDNNVNYYTKSGSKPGKQCSTGEIAIAIGYTHDLLKRISERETIEIILPKEGTGFEISSMSLIKNGPHLKNARTFYNWMLGKKAQIIMSKYYVIPVSNIAPKKKIGIVGKKQFMDIKNLKTVVQDMEWDAKNKVRLVKKWNKEIGSKCKHKIDRYDKFEIK